MPPNDLPPTPATWKPLFRDCATCHGPKVSAILTVRDSDTLLWVCLPCTIPRRYYDAEYRFAFPSPVTRVPTPGTHVKEYLQAYRMTPRQLSERGPIAHDIVKGILAGTDKITASIATRLAKVLHRPAAFWLGLQQRYDAQSTPRVTRAWWRT